MSFQSVTPVTMALDTSADLPQHRFVSPGASGVVQATAALGTVGVSLEGFVAADFAAGNEDGVIPVAIAGIVEVEAGAAVAVGAVVTSDASGQAVTAASPALAQGVALSAAGAAGQFITVLLQPTAVSQ